jgi:hypothetical protein
MRARLLREADRCDPLYLQAEELAILNVDLFLSEGVGCFPS